MLNKMLTKIVCVMLLIASLSYGETYKVHRVVDGDTVDIINPTTNTLQRIRLAHLDTMESMRNKRAKKLALECNLDIADIVINGIIAKKHLITLIQDKNVNIVFMGLDVRGLRTVGDITTLDNINVSDYMISNGYGLPYTEYIHKEDRAKYEAMGAKANNVFLNNSCIKKFEK